MNEWFVRQPCFICIKGIFLIFAVKCHQPFMVHAIFTAFVSGICCEIKHIPYVRCPDIWSCIQLFDQFLMIMCLCLLYTSQGGGMNSGMMKMLSGFTVLRMINMMGLTSQMTSQPGEAEKTNEVSKEQLLAINDRLNQIRK